MQGDTVIHAPTPGAATPEPGQDTDEDDLAQQGAGLGIRRIGRDGIQTRGYPRDTEVVHVGPFLAWLDRHIEAEGFQAAMFDLKWNRSDQHRLGDWRRRRRFPYVPVAMIEDALHHAGVRLVEVYPETDAGDLFNAWCPTCKEDVTVEASLACPWCDTHTSGALRAAA
jgi:hypothetical protein